MRIGVPKEIKNNENRVGLIPENVRELVAHGHEVWVETQAGQGLRRGVICNNAPWVQNKQAIVARSLYNCQRLERLITFFKTAEQSGAIIAAFLLFRGVSRLP